ncbi:MAG: C39 family peptidase [Clostridia bacterium]|nr:C39 family peptidase [Clostridia bacterium]
MFKAKNISGSAILAAIMLCCVMLSGCDNTPPEEKSTELTTKPAEQTTEESTATPDLTETEQTTEEESSMPETTDPNAPDIMPEDKDYYKNDIKLFHKSVMFSANEFEGEFNSVYFKNDGLMLEPDATQGTFISNEVDMGGSFKHMLASWNASSEGGTVEISVSAKLDDGSFTGWYSWGEWSAISGVSASKSTEDEHGEVGIDILTLKKQCQGIVRYRIDIKKTGEKSPVVYNVTLACDKKDGNLSAPADTYAKLDVPYRRQGDVPEIGGSICSATSLSMVMLYHGEQIDDIADVAWGVRDYGEQIFGNWAFNVAYAGELGYNAYIDYFDIDAIKYAVSTGHPIVCSIRVKAGQLAESGHPGYSTNGHLLCVVGFEEKDGKKWLLINDPAHPEVKALLESEFENVYRGVSYIVQTRPDHSEEQ